MQLEKLRQKMLEHETQTRNRSNKDAKVTNMSGRWSSHFSFDLWLAGLFDFDKKIRVMLKDMDVLYNA